MPMIRKVGLVAAGLLAFILACAGVATMQMIIGGLMPGGKDTPADMEPTPEEKAKKEWEAQLKSGSQPTTASAPAKEEPAKQEATPALEPAAKPEEQPAPAPVPQPTPQPTYTPPRPTTGPGNFDAPEPYYQPPAPTGPGNL